MKFSSLSAMASVAAIFSAAPGAVASEKRLLRKQDSSALEDAKFWNRALAGSSTPPKCKDEDTILGWVLDKSGGLSGFDNNKNDFDILIQGLVATKLVDAVKGLDGNTVTLPTDEAFFNLAGQISEASGIPFDSSKYDEEAAFKYILEVATALNPDPIGIISTILLYHISDEPVFFDVNAKKFPFTYGTLCGCDITAKKKNGNVFLEDVGPLPDPRVKNSQTDIELCNGQISVITGVLFLDVDFQPGRRLTARSLTESCSA